MPKFNYIAAFYHHIEESVMPVYAWRWFTIAVAFSFLAYWTHLSHGLNDWLGSGGFHLSSPASTLFAPLPGPLPELFWLVVCISAFLLLFNYLAPWAALISGMGFFYATMCDPVSAGALNMHFLFALAVIFWSTCLKIRSGLYISAWPAYLVRTYLVVVYFGSGWRKVVFGNWFSNPNALFTCVTGYYTTDVTRWIYVNIPHGFWTILQYTTIVFELGAPLLFTYLPLRRIGLTLGCMLHLGIAFMMKDLFYFSFQMLTFYIPFFIGTYHRTSPPVERGHQSAT